MLVATNRARLKRHSIERGAHVSFDMLVNEHL
jgi:hypothetical protein